MWPPRFMQRTILRVLATSAALLILSSAFAQVPPPIVEYKEVVPITSGQIRDGKTCINFNPVMTAGDFFDGLQRRETMSGDEFLKNSQMVRTFPDQITVQIQTSITVCDADIYTAAAVPSFFNGLRFKAQWKRGLAALAWLTHSPLRLSASPTTVVRQTPATQPGTLTWPLTLRPLPVVVSQRTS